MFYPCRNATRCPNSTAVPTIIWLQGGPGGSSQIGNFIEMGPNELEFNTSSNSYYETPRAVSWNDYYNIMIVDNPVGTGLSIADWYRTNSSQVGGDFVNFLVNFYSSALFAPYVHTPLYIFGESYAGHWVPSVALAIVQYNTATPIPSLIIPLRGIGVGDGWSDPINQLSENGLFAYSLGLVDDVQKQTIEYAQIDAVFALQNENYSPAFNDFDNIMGTITTDGGGLNIYNFRDFGGYSFTPVSVFLNQPSVQAYYNVAPGVVFMSEQTPVYDALAPTDFMQSTAWKYGIVKNYIDVLLYNGQDDIICNSPSSQNWIGELWAGENDQSFYNAPLQVWMLPNGTNGGLAKNSGNFTFTIINKAGHLAPYDQINSTVDMINRYIQGFANWTNSSWSNNYW